MDLSTVAPHDIFVHIRTVMGIVVSLGIARILTGAARIIQHPGQCKIYPVHLLWGFSQLLLLIHWWWWEFGLGRIEVWTFGIYAFVVTYAIVLYLMSAMLFPDSMADYKSYEDYFYSRRAWIFGLAALNFLLDVADTLIKGSDYMAHFGSEYLIRTPILVLLCIGAIITTNRRYHTAFAILMLAYQISWIGRLFYTIA